MTFGARSARRRTAAALWRRSSRPFTDLSQGRHRRRRRPRYLAPVPTYLVRVWLPDRPGALGQVASRIGAVRGDVVGIEILERGAGRAIDELVVELPEDGLVDLLVSEISQVDGVDVEDVHTLHSDRHDPGLTVLATATRLMEAGDD